MLLRLLVFDCRNLPATRGRLWGFALVVVLRLPPTGVPSWSSRSLRGDFAFIEELAVAYLSAMISSLSRVSGSSQNSLCLRRVPSLHPALKYSIAYTSCTPSQEFQSSAQRVR